MKKREAVCLNCGESFTTVYRTQLFCSPQCREKFAAEREARRTGFKPEKRRCLYCGKVFKSKLGGGWHCSSECCQKTILDHAKIRAKKAMACLDSLFS